VSALAFAGGATEQRGLSMRFGVRNQMTNSRESLDSVADSGARNGALSSALASMFRGRLCDVVLWNRTVTTFEKDQVIYDVGD